MIECLLKIKRKAAVRHGLRHGSTSFPNIYTVSQNSWSRNSGIKQIPYRIPLNISHHRVKCSLPGDLAPVVCIRLAEDGVIGRLLSCRLNKTTYYLIFIVAPCIL